jgi:hypothetical protein
MQASYPAISPPTRWARVGVLADSVETVTGSVHLVVAYALMRSSADTEGPATALTVATIK